MEKLYYYMGYIYTHYESYSQTIISLIELFSIASELGLLLLLVLLLPINKIKNYFSI